MPLSSPFGQYASVIAAAVALGVLAAWLAGVIGFVPTNPTLDSVALLIIGVIFGTGVGATVVGNGAGRQAEIANVRLDALHAPPGPAAMTDSATRGDSPDHVSPVSAEESRFNG